MGRKKEEKKDKKYKQIHQRDGVWKFKGELNLKIGIDDNFYGFTSLVYNSKDITHSTSSNTQTEHDFRVEQAYLGYKKDETNIQLGKQKIESFFTNKEKATGIRITNQDIENIKLSAAYMDALEKGFDKKMHSGNKDLLNLDYAGKKVSDRNLIDISAEASYQFTDIGLHYMYIQDLASLYGFNIYNEFSFDKYLNLRLHAQYTHSELKHKKDLNKIGWDNGNIYALELATDIYNFDGSIGYANWSTKKYMKSFGVLDDEGDLMDSGKQYDFNYNGFSGKNAAMWLTAGYWIEHKIRIGGDYVRGFHKDGIIKTHNGDKIQDAKTKYDEKVARVTYKYNKKLKFNAIYSRMITKYSSKKDKIDEVRLEAKYIF